MSLSSFLGPFLDMVFVDTDLLVVLENAVERDTGDHFEKGTSYDWRNCKQSL
jgi:hypothetical protein